MAAAALALLLTTGVAHANRPDNPGSPPPPAELNGRYLITAVGSTANPNAGRLNWDLFSVNLDGSDLRQLTDSPLEDEIGAWSPDGTQIAYMSYRTGTNSIWVMDADGGHQTPVATTLGRGVMAPSWSPDGRQLAYMTADTSNQIYVVDLATGQNRQITSGRTDQYPTWSPDGKKIAYNTYLPGSAHYDIVVVNADGTNPTPITTASPGTWGMAAWSPDGTAIAAVGWSGDIVLFDPADDGSHARVVATASRVLPGSTCSGGDMEPSWSPDSQWVMYRACDGIRIVKRDGTGERNVFTGPPGTADDNHVWPRWQPRSCSPTGTAAPAVTAATKGITQVCGAIPIPPPGSTPTTAPAPAPPTESGGDSGAPPPVGGPAAPAPLAPGAPAPSAGRSGYWILARNGAVYAFGDARSFGNASLASNAVDLEPTPSGQGYWVVDDRGRVAAFGDAKALGGAERVGLAAGETVTSLSATPSGAGYWIFTSRGRVLPFGDAPFLGDMSGTRLNGPVLGSVATPTGRGYFMVASDGGTFAYGDAAFAGSMGSRRLNAPVQSLVPDGDGAGYWLVAADGGIFAFDAAFHGSMGGQRLNRPISGMVPFGDGYLMVAEDGGVFNFSSQPFSGSLGAHPPAAPVVAVAAFLPGPG